jgi:hypothetical protein
VSESVLESGMTESAVEHQVPVCMLAVDVESACPEFDTPEFDSLRESYRSAWVLLRKGGTTRSVVEIDLHDSGESYAAFAREFATLWSAVDRAARPVNPGAALPSISVVVPTVVSRTETLAECLNALAACDYPTFEVILVDNRPQLPTPDPLPAIVAGRDDVRVVRAPRPGISAARNAGIRASRAEIIAFTDDDVRVDPGWLAAIGRRFADNVAEAVVTGLVLPSELETPAQLMFERYYGGFSAERSFEPLSYGVDRAGAAPWRRARIVARDARGHAVRSHPIYGAGACGAGCNMAFRRSALDAAEPFDLALGTGTASRGGEDLAAMIDVLWRGGRVGYEPAAVVHHQHRRGYDELVRQMGGYGTGFTAMLTSLIWRDRSHLLGLSVQLPMALQRLVLSVSARVRGVRSSAAAADAPAGPAFPPELARTELAGYLHGPLAYCRARRAAQARSG